VSNAGTQITSPDDTTSLKVSSLSSNNWKGQVFTLSNFKVTCSEAFCLKLTRTARRYAVCPVHDPMLTAPHVSGTAAQQLFPRKCNQLTTKGRINSVFLPVTSHLSCLCPANETEAWNDCKRNREG
jgi:hypothetical protein